MTNYKTILYRNSPPAQKKGLSPRTSIKTQLAPVFRLVWKRRPFFRCGVDRIGKRKSGAFLQLLGLIILELLGWKRPSQNKRVLF